MARRNRHQPLALLAVCLAACAGCSRQPAQAPSPAPQPAKRLTVIATIFPLADWARQVGGQRVSVSHLLAPGTSPHLFEPTPADTMAVASSDLFVCVGLGLEHWVEKLVHAQSGSGPKVVRLGETLPRSELISGDPHVWLDPALAAEMVQHLAKAMAELDPQNASAYTQRARQYAQTLKDLAAECARMLSNLPSRRVVTYHPAFTYLFRRCGIEVVATIETSPGQHPSAAELAEIARIMRRTGTKVVCIEPQFPSKLAETLAAEVGAKIVLLDPLGDPSDPQRNSYVKLIRYNVRQLAKALSEAGGDK